MTAVEARELTRQAQHYSYEVINAIKFACDKGIYTINHKLKDISKKDLLIKWLQEHGFKVEYEEFEGIAYLSINWSDE